MKYYLIVGEASGDLHASRLMRSLKKYDELAEFRFFGGDLMAAEGGTRVKHYKELAYMGFAEMHRKGVDAVVARMNLQYKTPLQCDDEFYSRLWLEKQGVRYVFHQDIYRASDERLCLKATVELVCLIQGKLGNSEDYDRAFEKYFA